MFLEILKAIERTVGRVPSIHHGPRAVDLDILFYDDELIDTRPEPLRGSLENLEEHLVIPHPRMAEREFVLRPLYESAFASFLFERSSVNFPGSMVPDFVHPVLLKPIHELFSDVLEVSPVNFPAMIKVMPFPTYPHTSDCAPPVAHVPDIPHTLTYWKFPPARSAPPASKQASPPRRTRLMATLNVTPDSFSDGSDHTTLSGALNYAMSSIATGADIIDVGGYSTRPGARGRPRRRELHQRRTCLHGPGLSALRIIGIGILCRDEKDRTPVRRPCHFDAFARRLGWE